MKKSIFALTCLMLLLGGTACSKASGQAGVKEEQATLQSSTTVTENATSTKGETKNTTSGNTDWQETKITENLNENIKVDADIILPEQFAGQASIYNCTLQKYDEQAMLDLFFGDATDIKKQAEGVYTTDNASLDMTGGTTLSYSTNMGTTYNECSMTDGDPDKELSFGKKSDAYQSVTQLLQKIGVTEVALAQSSAIDVELVKQRQAENIAAGMKEEIKQDWAEDDGCYLFYIDQTFDKIPLLDSGYVMQDDTSVDGGLITAEVTKNGVESLGVGTRYSNLNSQGAQNLITARQALDAFQKKLDTIILTGNFTIKQESLIYYPVLTDKKQQNYQLVPVWQLSLSDDSASSEAGADTGLKYYFNAVTGEEMVQ